ncbi:MAG: cysteine hydrolase [Deltaproteobacteria bacterium]|nr:cysteine hydrolase [Deltaproteobacteria bacterium]MCL5791754.1 cysteine hydrolase [Deltaproteobacteria bacterium]
MKNFGKIVIYENLKEIVNPEHTAIVIWDVQNALVGSVFNKEDFTKKIKILVDRAKHKNIPVVYTKITPLPKEYESSWRLYTSMRRYNIDDPEKLPQFMKPGSPEAGILDSIKPDSNDIVINKHTASIFIGTHFEHMMRNKGITTLLFTGIATEFGIDSSARDAANRGFYPIVVEDCVSSSDKEMHEAALKSMKRVTIVSNSFEILKTWE